MRCEITRLYAFEAAHFLPLVPDGHKCKRVHGHNYRIAVTVAGTLGETGMVMDFFDLDAEVQPLVAMLDHQLLNDISGLSNPTSELLCVWFVDRLSHLLGLVKVTAWETTDAEASVAP